MSYLPQNDSDYSCMRAIEVVLLGRLSQLGRKVRQEDLDIVLGIMKSLNIEDLAMRKINELSGGQRKLVYIAQTLVGKPQVLLMDEPANSLDLQKQLELCQLLRKLVIKNNINLLVVLHDLNLAARYADQVVVFNEKGTIYGSGPVKEVFTEKMLLDVYGVRAHLVTDETGIPVVSPIASVRLNQVVG
jgi:iron complex transport system ATP-binding protein